jgi:hypothetical protein
MKLFRRNKGESPRIKTKDLSSKLPSKKESQEYFVKRLYSLSQEHCGDSIVSYRRAISDDSSTTEQSTPPESALNTPGNTPERSGTMVPSSILFRHPPPEKSRSIDIDKYEPVNSVNLASSGSSLSGCAHGFDFGIILSNIALFTDEIFGKKRAESTIDRGNKEGEKQDLQRRPLVAQHQAPPIPTVITFSAAHSNSDMDDDDDSFMIPVVDRYMIEGENELDELLDELKRKVDEHTDRHGQNETASIVESIIDNIWVVSSMVHERHPEMDDVSMTSSIPTRVSHRLS